MHFVENKKLKLKLSFTTTPGWPIPYFSTDLINELEIPAAVSPFLSKLGLRAAVYSLQRDMPLIPPGITTCDANLSFKYSKNLTHKVSKTWDLRFRAAIHFIIESPNQVNICPNPLDLNARAGYFRTITQDKPLYYCMSFYFRYTYVSWPSQTKNLKSEPRLTPCPNGIISNFCIWCACFVSWKIRGCIISIIPVTDNIYVAWCLIPSV